MTKVLEGKVAIVTGSSRGIGRTIAEHLVYLGAKVVINYVSSSDQADDAVKTIKNKGGEAVAVQADLTKMDELERLFSKTISVFGKLDILINNAGLMNNKPLLEVTEEDFDRAFDVNIKATYFSCQQAMKHMEEGGHIINMSTSVTGQMFPTYSVYAGAKGAVEQITRQLAKEFASKQISINAIAPGPTDTELFRVGKSEEQIQGLRNMVGYGRLGTPEDTAKVISLLVNDNAQWITGQTIRSNGGFI